MVTGEPEYDGIWRPERVPSGAWIAARYCEDQTLNRSRWREDDIVQRSGILVANYLDTLSQCEPRCDELNAKLLGG